MIRPIPNAPIPSRSICRNHLAQPRPHADRASEWWLSLQMIWNQQVLSELSAKGLYLNEVYESFICNFMQNYA